MKKAALAVLAMVAVLGATGTARAEDTIMAKAPFAFVVNGVVLPAGGYVITRDAKQPGLIAISTLSGDRRTLTLTRAASTDTGAPEAPRLAFERIGRQVFLSQVTLGPGDSHELMLAVPGEDAPRR
jgi:hypothetical protein